MACSLTETSTDDLVEELAKRLGSLADKGVIRSFPLFQLIRNLVPIACVDGIPLRRKDGQVEAMAIVRGTGKERGKLLSIGGRILCMPKGSPPESIESCLRRQFQTDLGCEIRMLTEWNHPVDVAQYAPEIDGVVPKDFNYGVDSPHLTSLFYPVELLGEPTNFGSTAHGGQEAIGTLWFTKDTMPPAEHFGYGSHRQYLALLNEAEKYI